MFDTGYHATGFHATGYHLRGAVIIEPPVVGGGGGTRGGPVGTRFNQAPPQRKGEPLLLAQALQEDEELLIILRAFVETIRWH